MISKTSVPQCLKEKLEFGNQEQIKAIKKLGREIEEQEKRTRKIKAGDLVKYEVELEFTGRTKVEVWATTESEAEDLAWEQAGEPDDWECKTAYVWKHNPSASTG